MTLIHIIILSLAIFPVLCVGIYTLFLLKMRNVTWQHVAWAFAAIWIVWYGVSDFTYHQGRLLNENYHGQHVGTPR